MGLFQKVSDKALATALRDSNVVKFMSSSNFGPFVKKFSTPYQKLDHFNEDFDYMIENTGWGIGINAFMNAVFDLLKIKNGLFTREAFTKWLASNQ